MYPVFKPYQSEPPQLSPDGALLRHNGRSRRLRGLRAPLAALAARRPAGQVPSDARPPPPRTASGARGGDVADGLHRTGGGGGLSGAVLVAELCELKWEGRDRFLTCAKVALVQTWYGGDGGQTFPSSYPHRAAGRVRAAMRSRAAGASSASTSTAVVAPPTSPPTPTTPPSSTADHGTESR